MRKIFFIFCIICSFLFCGCNAKTSNKEVQNISTISSQEEQVLFVPQPKKRLRIQELEWYVGKWKELRYDDLNPENPPSTIELEIKKNDDEYNVILNNNGNIIKGKLYIAKYFLPENISEEEKTNYDLKDYVVIDFSKYRYWIGIRYDDDLHDKISLNLDDNDVFVLIRE